MPPRAPPQFQFIVADESHYLKSVDAKRSQAVVPLMQKAGEWLRVVEKREIKNKGVGCRIYFH